MVGVQISAKVPANAKENKPELNGVITVQFPDVDKDPDAAYEEAKKAFGAKAILTNAFANWRVTLQSNMRSGLAKGEKSEQLQARLGSAKMGIAQAGARVDAEQAFLAKFQASSKEDRAKMIENLKKMATQ